MNAELLAILLLEDEVDPQKQIDRLRRQQEALSQLAFRAAEERWPGFGELASALVDHENRLLRTVGPQA